MIHALSSFPADLFPSSPIFGLSDQAICERMPQNFQRRYRAIVSQLHCTDRISGVFQRLYFETQGGPTRRAGRRPGDRPLMLQVLDCGSFDFAFVHVYKNLQSFYEGLPSEERRQEETVFRSLFETMELSRELFFMVKSPDPAGIACMAERVVEKSHRLPSNGSLLIPGGDLVHAVLYEIRKQLDGAYSFVLYNSGPPEGVHAKKGMKFSNIIIRNIDPSRICVPILYPLLDLLRQPAMSAVYARLQTLGPFESDDSFHYSQGEIGSCSFQCLIRWVKGILGKSLYHRAHLHSITALLEELGPVTGKLRDDTCFLFTPEAPQGCDDYISGKEIQTMVEYARRSVQKISRSVFIEKTLQNLRGISSEEQDRELSCLMDKDEIQRTLSGEADLCFVSLKIYSTMQSMKGPFLEKAQPFLKKALERARALSDVRMKEYVLGEIANVYQSELTLLNKDVT